MSRKLTYQEWLELESLQNLAPVTRVKQLSALTETARKKKDSEGLEKIMRFIEQENTEAIRKDLRLVFHYNSANAYGYFAELQHRDLPMGFEQLSIEETKKEIIHLRKAFALLDFTFDNNFKAQVCTNLGSSLSHIGRFVEALEYWRIALHFAPKFGMAMGNLGKSLLHYAHLHYDQGQQYLMGQFAYQYLSRAIRQKNVYPEAKAIFKKHAAELESWYGKKSLKITHKLDGYSNGRSNEEKDYRNWSLENGLFLNPLNDVTSLPIANHDSFFMPSLRSKGDEPPFAFTLFNQIKQEYVSARYLFFDGLHTEKSHFSDRGNSQMDVLDYAIYGFHSEKMKIAYRMLYSLFDKIGFIIKDYFNLVMDPKRKPTFGSIWYEAYPKFFHQFKQIENWPLRGLFWLSKDIVERKSELTDSLLPDAQEIATVRHFIEHKSFKIIMEGITELKDDEKTYCIAFEDFYAKTMTLFKLSRAAMIYLSLALHREEEKKPRDGFIMPMILPQMEHMFKR